MNICLKLMMTSVLLASVAIGEAAETVPELDCAVLNGDMRTTCRIVMDKVDNADRAADSGWLAAVEQGAFEARQVTLREKMIFALGGFPERAPLNAEVTRRHVRDGYSIEEVLFESHPRIHVTALLFLPDVDKFPGRNPGVIVTCGHSDNGKAFADYQRMSLMLAKSGIAALIYDPFDQGERIQVRGLKGVHGHNSIGACASLVGMSMAGLRIWDGMRALDYLESRPEVDPSRLGVCGQSGGGTMTSLIMATDARIRCAAPSCFISTMRDVYREIGPQDAEQNVFGQLSFGLNHLGLILMRAPSPVLVNMKTADFFPIQGALQTAVNAKSVASRFGWSERFSYVYGVGQHGWSEGNRTSSVDWMREWLRGEKGAWDGSGDRYRLLDIGFDLKSVDRGIPEAEVAVAPGGSVLNIPGERLAYDLFRDRLGVLGSAIRRPAASVVAARAGIRPIAESDITCCTISSEPFRGGNLERLVFVRSDGLALPAVLLVPAEYKRQSALLVADDGRRASLEHARELFSSGVPSLLLDVSGTGEIAKTDHVFYRATNPDEEVAVMLYALGRSLSGVRAEEMAFAADWMKKRFGGESVDVVANGRVAIAAHHARGANPGLFGRITDVNAPPSWREIVEKGLCCPFACVVFGGLLDYDWIDL